MVSNNSTVHFEESSSYALYKLLIIADSIIHVNFRNSTLDYLNLFQ
jgi:hypothetical protein